LDYQTTHTSLSYGEARVANELGSWITKQLIQAYHTAGLGWLNELGSWIT